MVDNMSNVYMVLAGGWQPTSMNAMPPAPPSATTQQPSHILPTSIHYLHDTSMQGWLPIRSMYNLLLPIQYLYSSQMLATMTKMGGWGVAGRAHVYKALLDKMYWLKIERSCSTRSGQGRDHKWWLWDWPVHQAPSLALRRTAQHDRQHDSMDDIWRNQRHFNFTTGHTGYTGSVTP